eukprot:SAG11_NODE_9718_length_886_cov_1.421855_1_plen_104_part_10
MCRACMISTRTLRFTRSTSAAVRGNAAQSAAASTRASDLRSLTHLRTPPCIADGEGNFGLEGIEAFLTSHLPGNPVEIQLQLPPFHLTSCEIYQAFQQIRNYEQ